MLSRELTDSRIRRLLEIETLSASNMLATEDGELFKKRAELVNKRLDQLRDHFLPWIREKGMETDTMLDSIAAWYAVFAPDAEVAN